MRRTSHSGAAARIVVLGFVTLLGVGIVQAIPVSSAPVESAALLSCDVPPRTFEDITWLIQFGRSAMSAEDLSSASVSARSANLEDVQTVLSQFVACSGAGEPLRVWSLYTEAYMARLFARERGYDCVRYDLDSEPHPTAPSTWPQLTGPDRVWTDGSGRTVADVTIHYPNLDRTKQLRFWFAWQDGQVRIDEVDGEITFAVP